jgi:hypothetical protein
MRRKNQRSQNKMYKIRLGIFFLIKRHKFVFYSSLVMEANVMGELTIIGSRMEINHTSHLMISLSIGILKK